MKRMVSRNFIEAFRSASRSRWARAQALASVAAFPGESVVTSSDSVPWHLRPRKFFVRTRFAGQSENAFTEDVDRFRIRPHA